MSDSSDIDIGRIFETEAWRVDGRTHRLYVIDAEALEAAR